MRQESSRVGGRAVEECDWERGAARAFTQKNCNGVGYAAPLRKLAVQPTHDRQHYTLPFAIQHECLNNARQIKHLDNRGIHCRNSRNCRG